MPGREALVYFAFCSMLRFSLNDVFYCISHTCLLLTLLSLDKGVSSLRIADAARDPCWSSLGLVLCSLIYHSRLSLSRHWKKMRKFSFSSNADSMKNCYACVYQSESS